MILKLTPKQRELIDTLIDASETWGWERDQGIGAAVTQAEKAAEAAKAAMISYMMRSNVQVRRLKAKKA